MKPKFRLKQKVRVLSVIKTNGDLVFGTVIGVELYSPKTYWGYVNEKEYFSRFTDYRYLVAYEMSRSFIREYFEESKLEKV